MPGSALARRLNITHPVLSAPMAGVSGGRLAAAVSRAGGLGLIGGGYGNMAELRSAFADAEDAPVGVGFITWAVADRPELIAFALNQGIRAAFFSFGDFGGLARPVRDAGVPVIAQVQTVAGARQAIDQGADIIVAQGSEAGGHGGGRGTLALVPAVIDAVGPVPVLAAGGIADGRGLAAALMLGAEGVVCGTAFYASTESLAHGNAKRAALEQSGDATARHAIFDRARGYDWPSPWTLRALENDFSTRWRDDPDGFRRQLDTERARYAAAVAVGDTATAAVIVGEAVDLVRAIRPAAEILRTMVAEAETLLRGREPRHGS